MKTFRLEPAMPHDLKADNERHRLVVVGSNLDSVIYLSDEELVALRAVVASPSERTDAYQAGFRDGEAANDAARDKALGYELRPEQAAALKAYDPEFADRLANGAYDRDHR
jgi:hypothetical protein